MSHSVLLKNEIEMGASMKLKKKEKQTHKENESRQISLENDKRYCFIIM